MEVLKADNLETHPSMAHGFFTSAWGSCGFSSDYNAGDAEKNRGRVADYLSIPPDNLISCYQVHSPKVVTVTKPWGLEERPEADALVTKEKGIGLGILTADCVPLLFMDGEASVIGAAHAGWRGAISGVIENTLLAMEALGARRKSIEVGIGPCIWQNSYEVGPEFPAPFLAEDLENKRFFRPAFRSDHFMFNLPGYVDAKLRGLGLVSIGPSPADTAADEKRFFSYRRSTLRAEKRAGNLISAITLKPNFHLL